MPRTSKPSNGSTTTAKPRRPPIRRPNGEAVADDLIAKRAYEIYEARGGQHGADFDDWLEAERQITIEFQFRRGEVPPRQTDRRKRTRAETSS
jgi:Protein of unknown function (DUF2934)